MKRKSFYLLALSALMLSGCSNETDLFGEDPNGGPEGAKQQVTFLFPGTAQGVVPYADAIASEAENEIKTLDVYVFGADKLTDTNPSYLLEDVIKLTPETGGGLTVAGEDMKAAVSFVGTNRKCLYFVANGAGQTALNDYELGVTDTLTFIKKQTTSLGTGLLKAPLLMTGRYTFKAKGAEDDLTAPEGGHNVTLNRRVARFDIRNDSEESTLEIEKILIKNTRQGAYLFAFGDGDAKANPAIPATRPAYPGATIPQLMELDFLSFPSANTGTTGSVFYVYPNTAGTIAANDFTSFELKGRSTQSGEVMVQPVKMQLKQTGTPAETALLPINPNHRYTISILATGLANVEATITVKEWVVGEKVDVEAGFGQVKMTLTEDKPDDGIALTESKLLTVPSGLTATIGINVAADTEWEIVEKDAELTWMTITGRPTPGIDATTPGEVGKKFTLGITKANPSTEAREQVLHIRNVKRPSIVQTLTVQQAGNTGDGFKVTGEKLENNTLLFFGSADVTTLTLTLPGTITSFDATTGESWITLEKGTSATRATIDGKLLKVSVAANDGDIEGKTERTGTFTIKVGQLEQIIEVKQAPRNLGNIVVNAVGIMNGELNYKGADVAKKSLLVRALTEWKVTTVYFDVANQPIAEPTDKWITNGVIELKQADAQTRTNYNGQYNFTPVANTTFIKRKAQMTVENIHDAKIKQTITIFQEGKLETLTLTGAGYNSDVLQFAADATATVELTAKTDKGEDIVVTGLTATASDDTWLTIAITDNKITVTPKSANDKYTERISKVTVKMANANDKVFTVKQAGKAAPTFTVSGDGLTGNDLSLVAAGVTAAEYTVTPTPAVYTGLTVVKSDDATNWLTLTSTDIATNDGKFTLTAGANETGAARTATLTVTLPNALPQVITVKQAAAVVLVPSFTVSGTDLTGTAPALDFAMANTLIDAKTFTVGVKDAVLTDLTIVQEAGTDTWLTLVQTSLTADGTFTLAATPNPDQTARTATISISLAGVTTPTVITVTQAKADDAPATPVISISDGTNTDIATYAFAKDAAVDAVASFTVSATETATVTDVTMVDGDWLTLAKDASITTNGQFTITCTGGENTTGALRTATVTVTVTGDVKKTFTVTQTGA